MTIATLEIGSIGTNCYVIADAQGTAAIIDCDGNTAPLYRYIEENHLQPTHILLTHGHFDHIGAVEEVKAKYGCQVYAAKEEMRVLADPSINFSASTGHTISITPDVCVTEGDVITVGDLKFTVLLTPGHTEGSICFMIEDCIFSGDTLFQGSCGRTDFPTGDWQTILQSLKRLRDLPGNYHVYPGHGPATTLDIERRMNPYM